MWYEGKVLEGNGDQNPVVLWLLMEEYLVHLGLRPLFAKLAFLSMFHQMCPFVGGGAEGAQICFNLNYDRSPHIYNECGMKERS